MTQFYYLPLLNLASVFTRMLPSMLFVYIVAFAMMCAVFYWGCTVSKRYFK